MPNSKLKDFQDDMHELILWHDAKENPPKNVFHVLMLVRVDLGERVVTSVGTHVGEWRGITGSPINVTHWAPMPEGPQ